MRPADPRRSDPRQASLFGFDLPLSPRSATNPPATKESPPRLGAPTAPPARRRWPDPRAPALRRFDDGLHRFDWALQRGQRRTLALRVDDAGVRVLAPRSTGLAAIETFIAQHAAWVARKLRERENRLQAIGAARIAWGDGGRLPYLGGWLTLRVAGAPALRHDARAGELHLPLPPDCAPQRVRESVAAWMQQQALALFTARAAHFAAQLGVQVRRVQLSQAATRWGSAKNDGSIRLHWRLLHFSPQLVDYVIAHEVAHLREMNHSPRFWAHVARLYPEFAQARRELRRSVLPPWD